MYGVKPDNMWSNQMLCRLTTLYACLLGDLHACRSSTVKRPTDILYTFFYFVG
jgi:hypothetical protein